MTVSSSSICPHRPSFPFSREECDRIVREYPDVHETQVSLIVEALYGMAVRRGAQAATTPRVG